MTTFKQLQDQAELSNEEVAEYLEKSERTITRWRADDSPSWAKKLLSDKISQKGVQDECA